MLFKDDIDKCGKAGLADPKRGLAVGFHDFSQMGVTICQQAHTLNEEVFVQDGL